MHGYACENNFGPLADGFEYASSCQPYHPVLIGPKPFFPCSESQHELGEEFRLWKVEAALPGEKQSGYDSKPGRSQMFDLTIMGVMRLPSKGIVEDSANQDLYLCYLCRLWGGRHLGRGGKRGVY